MEKESPQQAPENPGTEEKDEIDPNLIDDFSQIALRNFGKKPSAKNE